jgi:REP element-mobilizing transposase RayT
VTIVVQGREPRLAREIGGEIRLTNEGRVVEAAWQAIPERFPSVRLDAFVLMPNHVHFVVELGASSEQGGEERGEETSPLRPRVGSPAVGAGSPSPVSSGGEGKGEETSPLRESSRSAVGAGSPSPVSQDKQDQAPTLGAIVAWFKYQSTRQINDVLRTPGARLWQRNYYDHVIRDDAELALAREYIIANPRRWATDREHPGLLPPVP